MTNQRQITAALAKDPPAVPPGATSQGVTETLRQVPESLTHSDWSRRMLALEGCARLDLNMDEQRQDRVID